MNIYTILSGNNSFTGNVYVNTGGQLVINTNTALGNSTNTVYTASSSIITASGVNVGNNFVIGGSGTIQNVSSNSTTFYNGGISVNGSFTTSVSGAAGSNITFNGVISGGTSSAFLNFTGANATYTLANANTFSGSTRVTAGNATLRMENNLALQNSVLDLRSTDSGTVTLGAGITTPTIGGLNFGSGSPQNLSAKITNYSQVTALTLNPSGTVSYNGVISDGATGMTLTKTGAGTQILSGANTFTGSTKVTAGTLELTNNLALQNSALDTSGGGTVKLGTAGATPTIGGLIGSNNLSTVFGGFYGNISGLTLNPNSGSVTYNGSITDNTKTMTLTKTGNGTQVLGGTNAYKGATLVSAGTLLINGNSTSANGTITVASGAILGGSGTVGGALTVNGAISPGSGGAGSVGTFSSINGVTWNAGSNWTFDLASGNSSDKLAITGNFAKGIGTAGQFVFDFTGNTGDAGTWTLVTWTGSSTFNVNDFSATGLGTLYNGNFSLNANSLTFTAVPEPSTWSLVVITFAGVAAVARRRRIRYS